MSHVSAPPKPVAPRVAHPAARGSDRSLISAAAFTVFLAAAAITAFYLIYSKFVNYDDEGYILLSLQQFVRGHALYSDVYTQYGPFPFELLGAIYRVIGGTVTPDNARALVIVIWLATTLLAGVTVERITRSLALGLAGAAVAFTVDQALVNEPLHPDGLAALMILAIVATPVLLPGRRRAQMTIIGLLVAALLMTKINTGGAALLATCLAFSASVPLLARRRWPLLTLIAVGVLMPVVVMNKGLNQAWADNLALLIAFAVAALGVALARMRAERALADEPGFLGVFILALVGGLIAIAVVVIALGTSPGDLIHGVVTGPLGQPGAYTTPDYVPSLAIDLAIASLVIAFGLGGRDGLRQPLVSGTLRIIAAVLMWLWISGTVPISISPDPGALGVCLPIGWLAAVPPRGLESPPHPSMFARSLLAALPVLGAIIVYPVAGSQLAFAALAFVPTAAVILSDGLRELELWRTSRRGFDRAGRTRTAQLAAWGLAAALIYQLLLQPAIINGEAYGVNSSVTVPGMTQVRLTPDSANAYSSLVRVIRSQCGNFVTLPGMNSFYLWTRITPPTDLNATDWMWLLDASQQRHVVDVVSRIPRLCLIRNDQILASWTTSPNKPPPMRPLVAFVEQTHFSPIFQAGGYQVMVRNR